MKLTLTRISLIAIKAQRYLPVAMLAYAVIAVIIGLRPPDGDGGTGG